MGALKSTEWSGRILRRSRTLEMAWGAQLQDTKHSLEVSGVVTKVKSMEIMMVRPRNTQRVIVVQLHHKMYKVLRMPLNRGICSSAGCDLGFLYRPEYGLQVVDAVAQQAAHDAVDDLGDTDEQLLVQSRVAVDVDVPLLLPTLRSVPK